jgi:hypothetical protein
MFSKVIRNLESRKWATGAAEHYEARALFDFQAMGENELPFRSGELLRVAPKGWSRAVLIMTIMTRFRFRSKLNFWKIGKAVTFLVKLGLNLV